MSENVSSNIPPETRKFVLGDRVQLKGGEGPKMLVNKVLTDGLLQCVRWCKESSKFRYTAIHRDALAYHGDDTPLPPGAGRKAPITVTRTTLETAIRNGRHLLSTSSRSNDTIMACFNVVASELIQHVDIEGGNC
ncbi:hypothetical protein PQR39_35545 [Paraburkholderia sediminicola]|uniref:hypothetical protein n=1 Tax=Paraburkholderia sediminicola TaxID=458836 RepID=UPI0038B9347B